MVQQVEFTLRARSRGFHLITDEVLRHIYLCEFRNDGETRKVVATTIG